MTGEYTWCQLFSEPGNGSDLAGLTTRAERDGDEWIVNGQKLWSTSAHHADFGLLLARTDWDVPKHRGITYFVLPMHQPGVVVRPLRQMNGHASFNEVFLTDARVPNDNVVGAPGEGWRGRVDDARARAAVPHRRARRAPTRATVGPCARPRAESDEYFRTYRWYPQRAGRADLVVEMARETGRGLRPDRPPAASPRSSRCNARTSGPRSTRTRPRVQGRPPGAEGSLGKLAASVVARAAADVHALIVGAPGMLTGPDSLRDGVIAEVLVSVPAQSIAGGTDEIQRNIIGERVLGLPKEPGSDRDLPFRDVARNPARMIVARRGEVNYRGEPGATSGHGVGAFGGERDVEEQLVGVVAGQHLHADRKPVDEPGRDRHRRVAVEVRDHRERAHVDEIREPLGREQRASAAGRRGNAAAATRTDASAPRNASRPGAARQCPVDEAFLRRCSSPRRPGTRGRGWSPR